jgi:hypothetical protein
MIQVSSTKHNALTPAQKTAELSGFKTWWACPFYENDLSGFVGHALDSKTSNTGCLIFFYQTPLRVPLGWMTMTI